MFVYCVIAAPYVRNVDVSLHTFTLLMMIQNPQWTMSSLYSLTFFLKIFRVDEVDARLGLDDRLRGR